MKISDILANKQRLLKYAVITVGILAVLVIGAITATIVTSTPQFCANCHIMKPEYVTWQASAHSKISCVQCHVKPGMINALLHKTEATKELYKYVTKTYELPITLTEQIDNSQCLQCHDLKRKVSTGSDLVIPHKKHQAKNIPCIKCHQGVAHGNIASRGLTQIDAFKNWDVKKGRKLMTVEFTAPKMDLCMNCHERRGVTTACEACHSNPKMPDSHREKGFIKNGVHGQLAKKNIDYCSTCHNYITKNGGTSDALKVEDEDPVQSFLDRVTQSEGAKSDGIAGFARSNGYCSDCHSKKPPSHNDEWPIKHGPTAESRADGVDDCLICHAPRNDAASGASAKQAACGSCHPSIHKNKYFRQSHPIFLPPKLPILEPMCFNCHQKELCSNCHMSREAKTAAPNTSSSSTSTPNTSGSVPINANTVNSNNTPSTRAPLVRIQTNSSSGSE